MKFHILLAYYRRPKIVLNALQSIVELEYDNYEVTFIDDSGDDSFKDELWKFLPSEKKTKFTYHPIMQDELTKLKNHGSCHGHIMNNYIKNIDSDVVIILCDDDALIPNYLTNLDIFYTHHPDINYAYSYVKYFDPSQQHYKEAQVIPTYWHHGSTYTLNMHNTPIQPVCNVDSAQVSYRTKCFKDDNLWYPPAQTRGLDAAMFTQFYNKYGLCYPTGFMGQYKGAFSDQLGNRRSDFDLEHK